MVFQCISTFLRAKHNPSLCDPETEKLSCAASMAGPLCDEQAKTFEGRGGGGLGAGRSSSGGSSGSTALAEVQPATAATLEEHMDDVASNVMHWTPSAFVHIRTLQDAIQNHTHVDHMEWSVDDAVHSVAVKRLPNRWMQAGPKEFTKHNPRAAERPWCDLGIVQYLNSIKFPYACRLLGVFRDEENTYAVTTLADSGNLFNWCDLEPHPGHGREAVILPIAQHIFTAIAWLHGLGIAHRDLSLENILLATRSDGLPDVKIIDFAMATPMQSCLMELRGKPSYQAPEMHGDDEYDAFLADSFSLGVVLFAMTVKDYPWSSTKPGACAMFSYARRSGLRKFIEKRRLRPALGNETLVDVLSAPLTDLLEGLLKTDPQQRLTLGETCFAGPKSRTSVWDMEWLESSGGSDLYSWFSQGSSSRLAGG